MARLDRASANHPCVPSDLQFSLQLSAAELALQMRVCGRSRRTRTHVRIRLRPTPEPSLYEHMFATARAPTLAQRTLGALRLTRSFLLLEDDYDVDWEVDLDEPRGARPIRTECRCAGPGGARAADASVARARPRRELRAASRPSRTGPHTSGGVAWSSA